MKTKRNLKAVCTVFFAVFMMVSFTPDIYAQSATFTSKMQKKLQKENEKAYKRKLKEYKKEGWKLSGSSRTMEVALLEHYSKLSQKKNKELVGEVDQCRSINVCKQYAVSNAQNYYASMACANVRGKAAGIMQSDQADISSESDKFLAAYEKQVSADISGALTESYAIVKDNGSSKQYKVFFILDEEKARLARINSMKKSLKETQISLETMKEISKFIEEEVNIE